MKEVVLSVTFFLPMYNVFTFVCKFSACLHLLNSFYFFFSFIYHSISFSRYFYLLIRRHIYMLLFYHPYSYDPPHVYRWNNAFVSFTFKSIFLHTLLRLFIHTNGFQPPHITSFHLKGSALCIYKS